MLGDDCNTTHEKESTMPTFDAGADDLTYDFTKYVPDAQGTIPEPSSDQIEEFMEVLRQIMPSTTGADGKPALDLAKLAETYGDQPDVLKATINEAVSNVCSNTPTAEQIDALPYRVKQRFYGWVVGTFLRPEA